MKRPQLTLTLLFFLMICLSTAGCGGNEEVVEQSAPNEEVKSLVDDAEAIQNQVEQGRLLHSMAERDREQLKNIIYKSKVAVLRLGKNPKNKTLIDYIFRLSHELDSLQILRRDRPRIEKYFRKIREIAVKYAKKIGYTSVLQTPWRLYSYRFSEGLYPFGSVSSSQSWQADWSLDEPHVSVSSGRGHGKAWLVSPTFNLAHIKNPRFRFNHMIMLNAGDNGNFDRATALEKGFNVKVSTNYFGGDPSEADWTELDISPLPSSRNFHSVTSPAIDLSPYKGKNVTIALHYNMEHTAWGAGYVTWQVNEFEILGVGELNDYEVFHPGWIRGDTNYLFRHDFALDGLETFTQQTLSGAPANFKVDGHNGEGFVSISGHRNGEDNQEGAALLVSNPVDISKLEKGEAGVWVKQAINHYSDEGKEKDLVRIVAFERGEALNSDKHYRLEFERAPSGGSWDPVTSEVLPLPQELQDKEIQIGFYYESTKKLAQTWQLYEMGILELPSRNK